MFEAISIGVNVVLFLLIVRIGYCNCVGNIGKCNSCSWIGNNINYELFK